MAEAQRVLSAMANGFAGLVATLRIGSIRPEKLGLLGGTMTRAAGRSLELFFIDGRPEGMLTAEVFN